MKQRVNEFAAHASAIFVDSENLSVTPALKLAFSLINGDSTYIQTDVFGHTL